MPSTPSTLGPGTGAVPPPDRELQGISDTERPPAPASGAIPMVPEVATRVGPAPVPPEGTDEPPTRVGPLQAPSTAKLAVASQPKLPTASQPKLAAASQPKLPTASQPKLPVPSQPNLRAAPPPVPETKTRAPSVPRVAT